MDKKRFIFSTSIALSVTIALLVAGIVVYQAAFTAAEATSTVSSCDFTDMVGKAPDEDALRALDRPYRILTPGSAATMDYAPERINLEVDESGIVTRVYCG